jgi:transcriptional regulator with PAS, ATPase and Fis domain
VKGAFTGAVANRKGYFETANRGTIFFDEIGTLSADMQVKLLRVLQEREFMPVGSADVIRWMSASSRRPTPTCRAWWTREGSARICTTG